MSRISPWKCLGNVQDISGKYPEMFLVMSRKCPGFFRYFFQKLHLLKNLLQLFDSFVCGLFAVAHSCLLFFTIFCTLFCYVCYAFAMFCYDDLRCFSRCLLCFAMFCYVLLCFAICLLCFSMISYVLLCFVMISYVFLCFLMFCYVSAIFFYVLL